MEMGLLLNSLGFFCEKLIKLKFLVFATKANYK